MALAVKAVLVIDPMFQSLKGFQRFCGGAGFNAYDADNGFNP